MVKFGRHLQFLRSEQRTPAYLVEYKRLGALLQQEAAFCAAWRDALKTAAAAYSGTSASLWQRVLSGISEAQAADEDELRGARPLAALRAYHALLGGDEAQKVVDEFVDCRSAAVTNSEALRKLVKKYDKEVAKDTEAPPDRARLSGSLLPELYSSALAAAVDADARCPFLVLRDDLQAADQGSAATSGDGDDAARSLRAAGAAYPPQHGDGSEPLSVSVLRRASMLPGAASLASLLARFAPASAHELAGKQMAKVHNWGELAKTRASMKRRVEEAMVGRRADEVAWHMHVICMPTYDAYAHDVRMAAIAATALFHVPYYQAALTRSHLP